jgi:hypothetical protein
MITTDNGPISERWEHDHLDRVQVATFLTKYLNSIFKEDNPDLSSGHFVLNLNASWGQGKTFLLKNWAADLKGAGYPVVMFDAWANDFSKDPLVGFISELYTSLDPWLKRVASAKRAMSNVMKSAKKIIGASVGVVAGAAAGSLAEGAMDMLGGSLDISDKKTDRASDRISESAGQLAEKALKKHKDTKKAIDEFKKNLAGLIKTIESNKAGLKLPLYIFIDELDRCRPTYAIELLENIKHLFGVKGVFFVVATNKDQLCHSIKAIYGNSFDSSAYLGRFFDQEYTLPEPDNLRFANHLFAKYKLEHEDRLFTSMEKHPISTNYLAEVFAVFSDAFDLPLRDQEQTIHRIKAILAVYGGNPVYFDYLVFLLMLRRKSEPLFDTFPDEYLKNRPTYEDKLSEIFKGAKVISVPKATLYGAVIGTSQEQLFSLIHLYASMAKKELRALRKEANSFEEGTATRATIYREVSNIRDESKNHLPLSEYPVLVKTVGQLS